MDAIARRFDFVKDPNEWWYEQHPLESGGQELDCLSAYTNSGAQEYGRINLFLYLDRHDGHLMALINDLDAYGEPSFVSSVRDALVADLGRKFRDRRIEVVRHRGISPLGP